MNVWLNIRRLILQTCDRLFGAHFLEREAARLERAMKELETQTAAMRQQLTELDQLLHVIRVQMCVLYLLQRSMLRPDDWLRFAPDEDEKEEQGLNLLIEQLVRHGLAAARSERVGERIYVYHLRPDWTAIASLLLSRPEALEPRVMGWLERINEKTVTPPPPASPPAPHRPGESPPPAPQS